HPASRWRHDGILPRFDGLHVDSDRAADGYTVIACTARQISCVGARDQRFSWRAPGVDAGAAEKLSLDDGHLLAGSDEAPRQRWPGLPSANDDRIMMAHDFPSETRVVIPQLWRDQALTRAGLRPRSGQSLPPTVPA